MCAHRETAYEREPWSCGAGPGICGCLSGTCARLGESEKAQDRAVTLPLFHEMTDEEQDKVTDTLITAVLGQNTRNVRSTQDIATA